MDQDRKDLDPGKKTRGLLEQDVIGGRSGFKLAMRRKSVGNVGSSIVLIFPRIRHCQYTLCWEERVAVHK